MSIGSSLRSLFGGSSKAKAAPRAERPMTMTSSRIPAGVPSVAAAIPEPPPALAVDQHNWLLGVGGSVEGKSWFVGDRTATIGRAAQNAIQVAAPEVSRVHCQVRGDGESLRVCDLK